MRGLSQIIPKLYERTITDHTKNTFRMRSDLFPHCEFSVDVADDD